MSFLRDSFLLENDRILFRLGTVTSNCFSDEDKGINAKRVDYARNGCTLIMGDARVIIAPYKNRCICTTRNVSVGLSLKITHIFRDPQELKHDATESASSQMFHKYMNAARHGQDGGDCHKTYPCHLNTE